MPRRKHSISDFTGGLNTNADARDIRDNQFAELQNFLIDKNGVIRTLEDTPEANTVDSTLPTVRSGGDISPGSGLFGHPSDRVAADMGSSAAYDSDYFIFKANADNMTMDMFSKTNSQWYNSRISLYDGTGAKNTIIPKFYIHEGAVRVCDGAFGANSQNQYHAYTDQNLFNSTDEGSPLHAINRWSTGSSFVASFEDLGIDVKLHDSTLESPDASDLGDAPTRIVLSYWTRKGGKFKGQYEFGLAPVYTGKQEGQITVAEDVSSGDTDIQLNDKTLFLQVFIATGTEPSINPAAPHTLGDDRIIGVNIYFRRFTVDTWYHLKYVDLIVGDKLHWGGYDTTDKIKGIFEGSISMGSLASSVTYADTTLPTTITFDEATSGMGFSGRSLILRLTGAFVSPVYKKIDITSALSYVISVPLVNQGPTAESYNYKMEFLDENFMRLKQEEKEFALTGGSAPPPVIDDEDGYEQYDS